MDHHVTSQDHATQPTSHAKNASDQDIRPKIAGAQARNATTAEKKGISPDHVRENAGT